MGEGGRERVEREQRVGYPKQRWCDECHCSLGLNTPWGWPWGEWETVIM